MTANAKSKATSGRGAAPAQDAPTGRDDVVDSRPASTRTGATALNGELRGAPRSALWTFLLGVTGLLVLGHLLALLGRLTLGIRRPATLEVTASGIRVEQRTMLLGRVVRDRQTVVPLDALLRITREVRFARSGLYAGLATLAIGSYFGVGLFVDGLRAPGGSPSLLLMGLIVMLTGLVLDFGLSSLSDTARGRCQVTVVPVKGRPLCLGALEPHRADATLRGVASELGIEPQPPEPEPAKLVEGVRALAARVQQTVRDQQSHPQDESRSVPAPKPPPDHHRRRDTSDADIEAAEADASAAAEAEAADAEATRSDAGEAASASATDRDTDATADTEGADRDTAEARDAETAEGDTAEGQDAQSTDSNTVEDENAEATDIANGKAAARTSPVEDEAGPAQLRVNEDTAGADDGATASASDTAHESEAAGAETPNRATQFNERAPAGEPDQAGGKEQGGDPAQPEAERTVQAGSEASASDRDDDTEQDDDSTDAGDKD